MLSVVTLDQRKMMNKIMLCSLTRPYWVFQPTIVAEEKGEERRKEFVIERQQRRISMVLPQKPQITTCVFWKI